MASAIPPPVGIVARLREARRSVRSQGIRCSNPGRSRRAIRRCSTIPARSCSTAWSRSTRIASPMILSGKAHNEMLLGEDPTQGAIGPAARSPV